MKIFKEFKEFAMKGNVTDMAIGIIIGAAFGKIVSSLVTDIIMPPIGLLVGGVNFTDLKFKMKSPIPDIAPVTINYGNFIQVVFDFLIVAFAVFMLVKALNATKKRSEKKELEKPVVIEPTNEEKLLAEIRDLLKDKK